MAGRDAIGLAQLRHQASGWQLHFDLYTAYVQRFAMRYPILTLVFRANLTMAMSNGILSRSEAMGPTDELVR